MVNRPATLASALSATLLLLFVLLLMVVLAADTAGTTEKADASVAAGVSPANAQSVKSS